MTNIVFAFILLLFLFFLGSLYISKLDFRTNKIWINAFNTAIKLCRNNETIAKAFRFAKNDSTILDEDSHFIAAAQKEFGADYIEWLTDDLSVADIPCAVFKTLMHGYRYMAYIDHKEMSDASEPLRAFNEILPANGFESLPDDIIETDIKTINAIEDVSTRTSNIIKQLDQYADQQGGKILWLNENSDSYAFFVMFPTIYMQLRNTRLDDNHHFEMLPSI